MGPGCVCRRRVGLGARLERVRDALPDRFRLFAVFFLPLGTQDAFFLALLFTLEELFDFAHAHTCADPPPPAEEALPEGDGPHELGHPRILVLSWDVDKIESGGDEGEDDGACTKSGRSTISPPSLATVDKETPDDEKGGKEEGERGVADVSGICCNVGDAVATYDRQELHNGRNDGERA